MPIDDFEEMDESRRGIGPLVQDFSRRQYNELLAAVEELRTPMAGAFGGGGASQSFQPDQPVWVQVIGQNPGTNEYYAQTITEGPAGLATADGEASFNASSFPCYETTGNVYVPIDGDVVVRAKLSQGGDYLTFQYNTPTIQAVLGASSGAAYAWQMVYWSSGDDGYTTLPFSGTTTVNPAQGKNGTTGLPSGTLVTLQRGYNPGYSQVFASVQQLGAQGLPQVQSLNVNFASGGTYALTFDNAPGGPGGNPQATGAIAWDADAATIQAALQALPNVYPTLASGPQVAVTGTGPFSITVLGPYGVNNWNAPVITANVASLDATQPWLFDDAGMASSLLMESGPASKISALPSASTLAGSEVFPVVQGGVDAQASIGQVVSFVETQIPGILMESGTPAKISAFPAASTLTGSEICPVVQGGTDVRTTLAAIVAGSQPLDSTLTAISGAGTDGTGAVVLASAISGFGSGTVTSVSGSGGSTGLTLTGGPITGSGTLALGGTLAPGYGGTGKANNAASTITVSGAYALTATLTNTTSVTFPTSGTLATTAQLPSGANPSATIGTSATNGSATTFMRSDAAPALAGVITAAGPTGSATVVPVITYNAAGQLTTVTTAAISGVSPVGSALASGDVWVGNGSSVAAAVAVSGSGATISLSNAGVLSISAIANASLSNSSVTVNGTAIALGASGTVTAAAGTLTGTTLNSTVVSSSLTSVGTVATGTWSATTIAIANGGTGQTTAYAALDALTVQGANVASASTTNLATATGDYVFVTGTTTVTAFGTAAAGVERTVKFAGALTLTYNATSLILPGAANITTAAGDTAIFRSEGSGNWRCIGYEYGAVAPFTGVNQTITLTGNVTGSGTASFATTIAAGVVTSSMLASTSGSGAVVLATSATLVTPLLGTPTSGNLANCTFPTLNQNTTGSSGSCTGNAATVTTNANLTGPIASSGNATSITAQTGTGTTFAMSVGPTFTGTPVAPTASVSTNTTQIATTAFVVGQAATVAPVSPGTAAVGTSLLYARQDHVHRASSGASTSANVTTTTVMSFGSVAIGVYAVGAYVNLYARTAGSVTLTLNFVDEGGTSTVLTLVPQGLTSGTLSSIAHFAYPVVHIWSNGGTLSLTATVVAGSTCNLSGFILGPL